ncbi:MAG: sigma-70 family RNA polymerase sigma factor [Firmicutes bacterium]|nr:sigma-70 family RNA polymerase sigma factor [Bacillota bacterium]
MEDNAIIELYWKRSENAISETSAKYGGYCYTIAYNILANNEDSEECVNDTWMAAWNTMPPRRPKLLAAFLGKMTRYISLDRWKNRTAAKRGGGEVPLVLEELEECISGEDSVEKEYLKKEFTMTMNRFLEKLPETERKVFLCRYWYMETIEEISNRFGFSESKVVSMLHRTRKKLRKMLEQEGIA